MSKFENLQFDQMRQNGLKLFIDLNKERESFITVKMSGHPPPKNKSLSNTDAKQRSEKNTGINIEVIITFLYEISYH